ncbi:hypothetical protein ACWGI8_42390 [Streptomyces sp. NPDC054841]
MRPAHRARSRRPSGHEPFGTHHSRHPPDAAADKTSSTAYTTPTSGTHAWWTGSADSLKNESPTRSVPAAPRVTVNASAWYEIEADFDHLFAEYYLDGGANWLRAGAAVDGSSAGK